MFQKMLNCLKIDITLAALVRVFGHIVLIKIIQFSIGKLKSRDYSKSVVRNEAVDNIDGLIVLNIN